MRKNLIIILIILGLLGGVLGYQTKTVDAAAIVGDPWQFLKEFVIKPLVRTIANSLENKIVNSINKQISNIDGKAPSFITNWRNHLLDSQARGNDVFRSVLADTKLCGYFDKNLKTAFGADKYAGSIAGATVKNSAGQVVYRNKTAIPGLPSFQQMGNCTLPANLNVNTFRTDFARGGGWDTWNKLIQPQNNFFGAYSLALGEQSKQMNTEEKTTMDSAVAGQGFLSQRLGVGTSGIGPSGCANSTISGCMLYTSQSACESNGCTWSGGDINTPPTCGGGGTISRCTFMGKEVTPAQVLGKTAAGTIDTKLKRPGAATELTDIILGLFAAVVSGTTQRLANYIGQATYDQPPNSDGGYDEQQFQPGASDPNLDSQINSMNQRTIQLCMDPCLNNERAKCEDRFDWEACMNEAQATCSAQCSITPSPTP